MQIVGKDALRQALVMHRLPVCRPGQISLSQLE
jgi:hypothetical protein